MRRWSRWTLTLGEAGRWGVLALAAFYLNFVSVHLATEMHFHSHGEEHAHSHADQEHEQDRDQGHEHDHEGPGHAPHDASEHLLDVVLKGAEPIVAGPPFAIASTTFVLDAPVLFTWAQPVFERERPPGVAPPDPLQPRAPPLV